MPMSTATTATAATLRPLDVLLVRHAEPVAFGTPGTTDDERPLSAAGVTAAQELAEELEDFHVTAIYSSPYTRAIRTVAPLAERRNLRVHLLDDLRERRLSLGPLPDWRVELERAWTDADYALPGGESGRAAQRRAVATLDLVRSRHPDGGRVVLGSHGNLISLMLQVLEPGVGFAFHMAMPTPAVYRLNHDGLRWRVIGGHGFTPLD
ncbi:MAG TPA: histidine phosphatase family protein [Candidatus Limnocylindria bacterium]|nr:histidine phosphatase family protein [Candidatus Limnocylindria bacterium]